VGISIQQSHRGYKDGTAMKIKESVYAVRYPIAIHAYCIRLRMMWHTPIMGENAPRRRENYLSMDAGQ
jgi:hypothetical protein